MLFFQLEVAEAVSTEKPRATDAEVLKEIETFKAFSTQLSPIPVINICLPNLE